jgi:hypothetical protein
LVDYTGTTGFLEGDNKVKHLRIDYTTESGTKITLFNAEVAEVTWSDGSGVVRVEGKTQAAANSGLNLLEMLTGKRAEQEPEQEPEPEPERRPATKTTTRKTVPKIVDADPAD